MRAEAVFAKKCATLNSCHHQETQRQVNERLKFGDDTVDDSEEIGLRMQLKSRGVWLIVGQPAKELFEYQGDQRTDKPVVDPNSGVPQWRTRGLAYIPEMNEFTDASVRLPVNLAETAQPGEILAMTGEHLTVGLRGAAFSAITVTISGVDSCVSKGNFVDVLQVRDASAAKAAEK